MAQEFPIVICDDGRGRDGSFTASVGVCLNVFVPDNVRVNGIGDLTASSTGVDEQEARDNLRETLLQIHAALGAHLGLSS